MRRALASLAVVLIYAGACNNNGSAGSSGAACKTDGDCTSGLSCLQLSACPGGSASQCYKTCSQSSDCTGAGLSTTSESPGLTGFVCESCETAGGAPPGTGTKICFGVFVDVDGEAPASP